MHLPPHLAVLRHVAYAFTLYGFITLLMDLPGALVSGMLGMRLPGGSVVAEVQC